MAAYDIGEAFQIIEEEMIASMARNLKRHLETEHDEGLNYSMWQAEQLASLNNFRKNNKKKFTGYFSTINGQIEDVLRKAYETGEMDQEAAILEAIKKGAKISNRSAEKSIRGQFFTINEKKLNALIKATKKDMAKAETAMLRMADDEYRKIIFNSQVYYNTGAGTLSQCVDMATKDFLSKGINCIEYANGARVPIDAYASMALRTTQTRSYLQGESSKRDEWGINTVIVNKRGVACPRCLRYVGKVFYDDVWGNVPVPSPAKYPLLSQAIEGGLYHPNCKDIHTTYFEGISTPPEPMTEEQKKEAARVYNLEQRQRYNERQIRKYKRLYQGSVDPENKTKYLKKLEEWQGTQRNFVKANGDVLKRRYENEKLRVADFPEPPKSSERTQTPKAENKTVNRGTEPKRAFTPAKTREEAESFIRKYVNDQQFGALGVSYSGISVESANLINETLSDLYETFDIDKLGGVFVAKGNTKLGKQLSGAVAGYSPIRRSLLLNNNSLKNVDDIVKSHAEEIRLIQMYAKDPKSLTFKSKKTEEIFKAALASGRATVPETIKDAINHEMGHHLEKVLTTLDGYDDVIANMPKYAEKISGYATTSKGEYIAESFASYCKGEDVIDPSLSKLFDSLRKDSQKIIEKVGKSDIIETAVEQLAKRSSKDFKTIILPKQEYAHVMSELATHMSNEQRKQKIVKKAIGDYFYTVENNGFGNYRVIGKQPIVNIDIDE